MAKRTMPSRKAAKCGKRQRIAAILTLMRRMTDTAESLDPLRLPLIGERLIEASAGTGKPLPSPRCICGCCWGWAVGRLSPRHQR